MGITASIISLDLDPTNPRRDSSWCGLSFNNLVADLEQLQQRAYRTTKTALGSKCNWGVGQHLETHTERLLLDPAASWIHQSSSKTGLITPASKKSAATTGHRLQWTILNSENGNGIVHHELARIQNRISELIVQCFHMIFLLITSKIADGRVL